MMARRPTRAEIEEETAALERMMDRSARDFYCWGDAEVPPERVPWWRRLF